MEANEMKKISENYQYSEDGTLYYVTKKQDKSGFIYDEASAIANHTPLLKEYRTIDDGFEQTDELVFNALRNYHTGSDTILTLKHDIYSQTPSLKFGAACRIFLGKGAKARYSEAMQIQCEHIPHSTIYRHTGYTVVDGERVFLNGGYSINRDGLTDKYNVSLPEQMNSFKFIAEKDSDRYKTLLELFPKTACDDVIYASLGLVFLTPLNALLRAVGIEPRFILYFTGKTGTRKTTLAKLLLNFFGTFDNGTAAPANFRDTIHAVEAKFAISDSTLMLLDDRIPSTTPKLRVQMEAMEQAVARQIGDRSGRSRMNADGTLKATYRPNCNLIITAEESFSNVGESAIARSLSVELKPGYVNLDILSEVQQKAEHLNQCMSEYIQWVIVNWDDISKKAQSLFSDLRPKAQSDGHGRLAECVAHLQMGIVFMCEWLKNEKVIDSKNAEEIQNKAWDIFIKLAAAQNRRIFEEKPVKLFLDAVKAMMDRKAIRVEDAVTCPSMEFYAPMGYKDDNYYYFFPDAIYSEVRKFYSAQEKSFPLSRSALFQQLADDGLIERDKTQNTKTKRLGDKRPRMLWIKREALEEREEFVNGE